MLNLPDLSKKNTHGYKHVSIISTTQRSPSEKVGTHSLVNRALGTGTTKFRINYQRIHALKFSPSALYCGTHGWARLHAGCKESPVNVTSAGSRAQPHSLRPGIKLSYTRTVNRSSKWEQSSVMKRPSTAPRFQPYFPRDRQALRFLHSSLCTRTLWMDTRSYSFTPVSFNSTLLWHQHINSVQIVRVMWRWIDSKDDALAHLSASLRYFTWKRPEETQKPS